MKRLFGNLTLLILLIGGRAHLTAAECYDPYNSKGCAYYAEIEALYWKTYHCPIFIAERFDDALANGIALPHDQFYLDGAYNGGTRIRLGTRSCACFFDLSYLYFRSDEHESASRDGFNTMVMAGNVGDSDRVLSAKSTGKFRYQNLDGRLSYDLDLVRCLDAFLYSNARLMRIDFQNNTTGVPVNPLPADPSLENFFKQESEFKGGGVGFGVGTRAHLCGGLSLHGSGGVMAIYGASKLKNFTSRTISNPLVRINVLKTPQIQHHLFPGLELRAGLDYGFCICGRPVELEVGYELDYYAKVLRYASETEIEFGRAEIPHFTCQNIGFGGPYFRLALSF